MRYRELQTFLNKPSTFSLREVRPNIFLLNFKTRKDMSLTLLRFQEFYENRYFKGKKFSFKEFYNFFKNSKTGFSYHKDWAGFNFPSSVFRHFKKKRDLSFKEKQIIELFKNKKCYIIATFGKNSHSTLRHELCHASYFLNPKYKEKVDGILSGKDISNLTKHFSDLGYHPSVFLDEAHAYLCCDSTALRADKIIKRDEFKKEIRLLKNNYKKLV